MLLLFLLAIGQFFVKESFGKSFFFIGIAIYLPFWWPKFVLFIQTW
jgi:hypothetical protein